MSSAALSTSVSRAQFLKIAGAAAAATALSGTAVARADEAASSDVAVDDIAWDIEADVVVCGCGTCGAPAAIEAAQAGADVYVFEKRDWIGGCMRRCGGGFMAAGTSVQEKLGIDDNPEMMYEYLVALAGMYGDEDLIRTYTDNAAPTFEWIIAPLDEGGLGGEPLDEWEFSAKGPDEYWIGAGLNIGGTPVYYDDLGMPENYRPRCHWFKPNPDDVDPGDRYYADYQQNGDNGENYGGTGLWKPFSDKLEELGVRIDTETELTGLIQDRATKQILGVTVLQGGVEKNVKARKGVVLATGGFSNGEDTYETFTGQEYVAPNENQSWTGGYIEGQADGAALKAGLAAGAALAYPVLGNNGGLRISANAEVVDWNGEPISRLYAGGRVAGGYAGSSYPSCGFYIGTGVVFGRIAGQQVAALEPWE